MLSAILAVASGGAIGAVARFFTVFFTQFIFGDRFPIGTLFVNCLGSFLIGLFMSLYMDRLADIEHFRLFVVVGFLGAYTTFSSFAWDTWYLFEHGQFFMAAANILLNNLLTILMLLLGLNFGRILSGGL